MTRWWGKLIGAVLGALLLKSPPGLGVLLGALLGHAVDARWLARRRDHPHAAFGLPAEASDDDVDLAYRRLMAQVHPDRLIGASDDRRRQAEALAQEINAAYVRIKRRRARRG